MALSGAQKTRLGAAAFARSLHGSFSGKTESAGFAFIQAFILR